MPVSRREFLGGLAAGAALTASSRLAAAERDRTQPNLVWIITDQQPVSTLRSYGNQHVDTPLTDSLAKRGTRLTNYQISAFPCSPSRSCVLSGRECHNTGVTQNDVEFVDSVHTIGEMLSGAGYAMGYFGKWHLGGNMYRGLPPRNGTPSDWIKVPRPDDNGFKYQLVEGGTGEDQPSHGFETWVGGWAQYHAYLRANGQGKLLDDRKGNLGNHNDAPSGPEGTHNYSLVPAEHHVEHFLGQQAAGFVRQQAATKRPFGCVLSFYGPHLPVSPPQPWDTKYGLDLADLPANHRDLLQGKPLRQQRNSRCYRLPEWTDEQFRDYIRRYWGYVDFIETCAQQVLTSLDEAGQTNDTILLWTTDHGDMCSGHGMIYKLGSCGYEELLNVPFLLQYPGVVKPNAASDALTASVDVVPTLLDLMGLSTKQPLDGRSFAPVLRGETDHHRDYTVANWMEQGLVVKTHDHKLVFNHTPRDLDEVYDLKADPGELHNLAESAAGKPAKEELFGLLDTWLTETKHPYAGRIREAKQVSIADSFCFVEPQITHFKYLGGNAFELGYEWTVEKPLPYHEKCWSFIQFVVPNGKGDKAILFRNTTYPEPATPDWKAGDKVKLGPFKFEVPNAAGARLEIRIGLYDPKAQVGPGTMAGKQSTGNAYVRYFLKLTKEGGKITGLELVDE